jgi:hypothetical protein
MEDQAMQGKMDAMKAALRRLSRREITAEQYAAEVAAIFPKPEAPAPEPVLEQTAFIPDAAPLSERHHVKAGSQKGKLYDLLKDGLWHDTVEILDVVYGTTGKGIARIGARVADLKADGLLIVSRRKDWSVWEYRLEGRRALTA